MFFFTPIDQPEGPFLSLAEVERLHIIKAIEVADLNMTKAANLLGIGRSTLYRRIEDLDLSSHLEKLRSEAKRQKHEERESLRKALQLTSHVPQLCELLEIDEATLKAKMQRYHLSFLTESSRAQIMRLKSEASKLTETVMLLIAA